MTWKKTPAEIDAVIAELDLDEEQAAHDAWQAEVREQNRLVGAATEITRQMEASAARANAAFDTYMAARRARRGL